MADGAHVSLSVVDEGRGTELTFTLPVAGATGEDATTASIPGRLVADALPGLDDDRNSLRCVRDALAGSEYATPLTFDPKALLRSFVKELRRKLGGDATRSPNTL